MYKVYILPKERYCGVTKRSLGKRLWEHKYKYNRNTLGANVIAVFDTKREALDFEKEYQLKNNFNGYGYGETWRKHQSKKCFKDKPSNVLKKKIICVETGEVFESVRQCERHFKAQTGNLSKHLKGHKHHPTFKGLKFKYYNNDQ